MNSYETPILPSETEIERVVLGAILLNGNPAQIKEARQRLQPSDFTAPAHKDIFRTLCEMSGRGDALNPMVLQARLRAAGSHVTMADITALLDGIPHRSDLSTEIGILKDATTRREIIKLADHWLNEAQAADTDANTLARAIVKRAAELGAGQSKPAAPLALSWAELCELKLERGETILHEVERGETVMCAAVTNRGKTTFWRNAALSLACGRAFPPIVPAGQPRRVLYLDFETRLWKARHDIRRMLGSLTPEERSLIGQNLHVIADCRIDDRPLNQSNPGRAGSLSGLAVLPVCVYRLFRSSVESHWRESLPCAISLPMEIISAQQAAVRLGVDHSRVRQLIRAGRLPSFKVGREHLIDAADLALVANRRNGRPPKPKAEAQPVGAAELKQPQQFVAGAAGQGTATNGAAQTVTTKARKKAAQKKGGVTQ